MKLKINAIVFFLLPVMIPIMSLSYQWDHINLEHVKNAHASIENKLFYHKIYQITAATGLLAALSFSAYKTYTLLRSDNSLEKAQLTNAQLTTTINVLSKALAEKATIVNENPAVALTTGWSLINWFKKSLYSQPQKIFIEASSTVSEKTVVNENSTVALTTEWPFMNWIKKSIYSQTQKIFIGVGSTIIFTGLNHSFLGPIPKYVNYVDGLLDKAISGLFHSSNLTWFVKSHADFVFVFNSLEHNAAILEGRQFQIPTNELLDISATAIFPLVDCHVYNESLQELQGYWTLFVQQMELVIAFMELKSKCHAQPLVGQRMHAVCQKITILTNNVADSFEQKLNGFGEDKPLLYDDLHAFRAQIGQELSNFSALESFKRNNFLS